MQLGILQRHQEQEQEDHLNARRASNTMSDELIIRVRQYYYNFHSLILIN